MTWYLYVVLAYLLVLTVLNFYRARRVRTQEDMMVAGRSLSVRVMVFTLICTWIGSGTFIAGAEYAAKAGWSSLWLPAGAWVGIVVIYFLAAKIRTFGQYTIGDILEVRYGPAARVFGAIALIISFTAIVSYQFRAGGYILNVVTDGQVSVALGQALAAVFVILFTALAGMVAVAYTDLPNGIIILLACLVSVPFVYHAVGGMGAVRAALPPDHFAIVNETFGRHPGLKAGGYFLSTMMLLMGVQSMYQKFYSARTPKDARQAVALWVVGTIFVEVVVVAIAIFAAAHFWPQIRQWLESGTGMDPASIVLQAARHLVPPWVGILLLGAATAVVISTGMNYLLSPTTNLMRDIYQRFLAAEASQRTMVALQKVCIVILGVVAYLLATRLVSVLEMSYFAYTVYGVAITPALIAALAWKRATRVGGLASILGGTIVAVTLKVLTYVLPPEKVPEGDPWGIPLIYPALIVSVLALVVGSYLSPPPSEAELAPLFGKKPEGDRSAR